MTSEEKKAFLTNVRGELLKYGEKYSSSISVIQKLASLTTFVSLPFEVEFEFEDENALDKNKNYLFCLNHSNAYDGIVAAKALTKLNATCKFLAEDKDKTFFQKLLFLGVGSTMIDRTDNMSSTVGLYDFISKLLDGSSGVIFVEGTWNLHPTKLMQGIKMGAPFAAGTANTMLVPMIFEYEKSKEPVKNPKKLIEKCVVVVGKPIAINPMDLKNHAKQLYDKMLDMRIQYRIRHKKKILTMDDIIPDLYVYETYVIKFLSGLTKFDAVSERELLRKVKNEQGELVAPDNEFYLNEAGLFVPGSTLEERGKEKILYNKACESYERRRAA